MLDVELNNVTERIQQSQVSSDNMHYTMSIYTNVCDNIRAQMLYLCMYNNREGGGGGPYYIIMFCFVLLHITNFI